MFGPVLLTEDGHPESPEGPGLRGWSFRLTVWIVILTEVEGLGEEIGGHPPGHTLSGPTRMGCPP